VRAASRRRRRSAVDPIWVEKGDTFFTHSDSLLGRLIRWAETDPGETPAWTNHTGVVVESGYVGGVEPQAVVVEALGHVRKGPLVMNGREVRFFRPVPAYTPVELVFFESEANHYIGDKYGWWKLLLQLGDRALFKGRKILSNLSFIDSRPICSYLAAHVNDAARKIGTVVPGVVYWPGFGGLPDGMDPDTMMRFCADHPALWKEIK
jgi:hypothetical protein